MNVPFALKDYAQHVNGTKYEARCDRDCAVCDLLQRVPNTVVREAGVDSGAEYACFQPGCRLASTSFRGLVQPNRRPASRDRLAVDRVWRTNWCFGWRGTGSAGMYGSYCEV